jgi:prepilin-type N-terminal cleavage/methylation domain-containing protein
MRKRRSGLTLIEVIVAMLLFSTGALALAATTGAVSRQIGSSVRRSRAASLARERSERALASGCSGLESGSETVDGIYATWTVSAGPFMTIYHELSRRSANGMDTDRFHSGIPCN